MQIGAITGYIDVAQLALYAFWIFFAGLVFYLRSEDKREGYPLQSDRSGRITVVGFPPLPRPKTFILPHGGTQTAPRVEAPSGTGNATPLSGFPGAPLVPNGDPMLDGVGPAAFALRGDFPDQTVEGLNRNIPLRSAAEFYLEPEDPDPRGWPVVCADRQVAGVVADIWFDQSEMLIRFLEIEVPVTVTETRRVLLPMGLARVDVGAQRIKVKSVMAWHFAAAPRLKHPDQVTRREEDQISAYFASGHMYATASRSEPLL